MNARDACLGRRRPRICLVAVAALVGATSGSTVGDANANYCVRYGEVLTLKLLSVADVETGETVRDDPWRAEAELVADEVAGTARLTLSYTEWFFFERDDT